MIVFGVQGVMMRFGGSLGDKSSELRPNWIVVNSTILLVAMIVALVVSETSEAAIGSADRMNEDAYPSRKID